MEGSCKSAILAAVVSVFVVAGVAAAAAKTFVPGADAPSGPTIMASTDKRLARALVVRKSDQPIGFLIGLQSRYETCGAPIGFAITARASSPLYYTPHSGTESFAVVLRTKAEAKRYYGHVLKMMPSCVASVLRDTDGDAPPSIGQALALTFPRYGDQSAAWRLPVAYANAEFE